MTEDVDSLLENPSFININEPVALYFSYVDSDKYTYFKRHKKELVNIFNNSKTELIQCLKNREYKVVCDDSHLAAHPGTIVVSHTGIQTPFILPTEVKEFALDLIHDISNSGFARPLSKIFAIRLSQLPSPVLYGEEQKPVFSYLKHPDSRVRDYILYRYGSNFIQEQYNLAYSWGYDNTFLKKQSPHIEDLNEPLYSGRKLAIEPFYSYARNDMESRYQVFATPSYKHAVKFCGADKLFGLIHHYQKSFNQVYYKSFELEIGGKPQSIPSRQIETLVSPGVNDYLGLEMSMGLRSFDIPQDDERWLVFKEYHRAAYIPNNEIMKQRRINILSEAYDNGGIAVCYMPVGLTEEDLSLEHYRCRRHELKDVLINLPPSISQGYDAFLAQHKNDSLKASIKNNLQAVKKMKQSAQTQTPHSDFQSTENHSNFNKINKLR